MGLATFKRCTSTPGWKVTLWGVASPTGLATFLDLKLASPTGLATWSSMKCKAWNLKYSIGQSHSLVRIWEKWPVPWDWPLFEQKRWPVPRPVPFLNYPHSLLLHFPHSYFYASLVLFLFFFSRPQLCHIQWSFSCPQVGPHKDLAWLLRLMDNFSLSTIACDFKFGKIMSLI